MREETRRKSYPLRSIHDQLEIKINDHNRQMDLENLGLTVIRITNNQTNNNIDDAISTISTTIEKKLLSKRESQPKSSL